MGKVKVERSDCCCAPVEARMAGSTIRWGRPLGTMYYVCRQCGKPCQVKRVEITIEEAVDE